MYKFFINENQIENNKISIIGSDVNHIKNVLRLEEGETIYVCIKEKSKSFKCKILDLNKDEVKCDILEEIFETTEANTHIHIFQGLPKADKFEFIIEKCTEIGVKEITPVVMRRSIVKFEEKDKIKKLERWQKIAEVAAKQSKRDSILKVNNVINFQNVFEKLEDYDILLVAYEEENENTLKKVLGKLKNKQGLKVAIIIGPEGGIDINELNICKEKGFISITLGKRILRTETASLVISSNILYELED